MSQEYIRIIFFSFAIFISIFWTMTSPYKIKKLATDLLWDRIKNGVVLMTVWVMVQSLLPYQFSISFSFLDPLIELTGVVLGILGVALACWAKITMKSSWGVPAQHDAQRQKILVTSGPFSFSRNPIYVGLMMYFLGYQLAVRSPLILLIIPAFLRIHRAIKIEEALLINIFGERYQTYSKKVPRYLLF